MLYKVTHVTVTLLRWISMLQLECRLNVTSNCSFWFCPVFLTYTIYKINQVNQLFDLYIYLYIRTLYFFTKDYVLSHTIDVQFSTLQWNGINSFLICMIYRRIDIYGKLNGIYDWMCVIFTTYVFIKSIKEVMWNTNKNYII